MMIDEDEEQIINVNTKIKLKKNNIKNIIKENIKYDSFKLLPDTFVSLLIGKPNSGKSFLIRELLKN